MINEMLKIKKAGRVLHSILILLCMYILSPSVLAASSSTEAGDNNLDHVADGVEDLGGILEKALDLVLILLFIAFFVALVKILTGKGNSEEGGNLIFAVLALFVAVSFWGIITWLEDLFGIDPDAGGDRNPLIIPQTQSGSSSDSSSTGRSSGESGS